jgi:hypothetical protein
MSGLRGPRLIKTAGPRGHDDLVDPADHVAWQPVPSLQGFNQLITSLTLKERYEFFF